MANLNDATFTIKPLRGTAAKLTSNINAYYDEGVLYYATDTNEVYIHNGTKFVPIITNRTPSSATDTGIKGQVAWDGP